MTYIVVEGYRNRCRNDATITYQRQNLPKISPDQVLQAVLSKNFYVHHVNSRSKLPNLLNWHKFDLTQHLHVH